MNNKTIIPTDGFDRSILKATLQPDEITTKFFYDYLNYNDKLHTLINSFKMTEFNLNQISNNFIVSDDDRLKRTTKQPFDDFEVINALVINYLATARMFIDLIENFDSTTSKEIKEYIRIKYNESFYYRLMYQLRNFSLHGHLPVYKNLDRYSFNLDYILEEGKNFNFNKSAKESIEEIDKKIKEQYQDLSNISFSRTIVGYHKVLLEIYCEFFRIYLPRFKEKQERFTAIISDQKVEPTENLIFVYLDDTLHGFNVKNTILVSFEVEYDITKNKLLNPIRTFRSKITE